jgi:hypothetical protein
MSEARWWQTRWFALAAVLLSAVPLLWPSVPPLLDVPGHMGRYRVMLGTDAATLDQWYRFEWRAIGNLGVDLLVAALGPLIGLEAAVKLVVIAIPMLTVAGMLWISREAHGRVQPLALLALPLAYHMAFQYGFVNYALAMALALNGFALWLRLGRLERCRLRAALFVVLAWLVWAAHLFGWLVLGLLAFAAELMRRREQGRGWFDAGVRAGLACLPLALPFAMFLRWAPGDGNATSDYWRSFALKPGWLAMVLRDRWQLLDIGSMVGIALLLYRAVRSPLHRAAPALTAAASGLFLLFLIIPFGSAYADARLAPYAVMLALLAVRSEAASLREQAVLAMIGLAFFGARTAAAAASFAVESREWDRHLAALDHLPRGARVAAFVTNDCRQPWRAQRLNHLPGMAIARRAAFSNDQFDFGSTALMQVTVTGIDGYAKDPSQIVTATPCADAPEIRTLAQALAGLPPAGFDHVWLIAPPTPLDPRLLDGLVPVWTDGRDALYRIAR